jgi:hypothetical protein
VRIQLEVVEELGIGEHEDDGEDLATLVCGRDSYSIGRQQWRSWVLYFTMLAKQIATLSRADSHVHGVVNLMLKIMWLLASIIKSGGIVKMAMSF